MNKTLVKLLSNRLFVVLTILGIIALLFFLVYFLINHPKDSSSPSEEVPTAKESELNNSPSPTPSNNNQGQITVSPTITPTPNELTPGKIAVLSSREAFDVWVSKDDKPIIKYLFKSEGTVYQIDTKTKKEEIFSSFTPNLIKILWSPNGYHLINIFKQEENTLNKYSYNLITKENVKLDKNLKYIAWSSNGEQIAYHYYNQETKEGFISSADPDGKNWKNLTPVLGNDLKIDWPKKDKISFTNLLPNNTTLSDISIINPETGESPKQIIQKKYGLGILWSPSGTKLLFSGSDNSGENPKLYILNEALEQKTLNTEGIAEKCVWSKTEKFIYCAIPNNTLEGINMPQDWYSNKFLSRDIFLQINIETGEKKRISDEENYDALSLFLSPNEDYLYFVNKESGFLYELKI